MQLNRNEFLTCCGGAVVGLALPTDDVADRAARIIQEYDQQGIHRTGTLADAQSARWLAAQAARPGVQVALKTFAHSRVDPQACFVEANGKRLEGLPSFDAPFTSAAGLRGSLGVLGSRADIGWIEDLADRMESTTLQP